jgi:hypothetical protein
MKIYDDDDEMQNIQWISNFLFNIYFRPRFIADGDLADKARLLCCHMYCMCI